MKQIDFSAVFLKAKAFREKYTMGYLARPVSRPFCLELAGILERNRELLDSASDIMPGPELAKLAYEWGDKLATGSAACLEVLRNAHEGETFNERQADEWLKLGFLYGGELATRESPDEAEKHFNRICRNLLPELQRLKEAAERLRFMAGLTEAVQVLDDADIFTGQEALASLADEILSLGYKKLRFNRRAATLPHELAAFLGDVVHLAGVPVSGEGLFGEAVRFCRVKLGKAV